MLDPMWWEKIDNQITHTMWYTQRDKEIIGRDKHHRITSCFTPYLTTSGQRFPCTFPYMEKGKFPYGKKTPLFSLSFYVLIN